MKMDVKYFRSVTSLDELKAEYRSLCKINHPDKGGETSVMQEINAEYSYLLKNGRFDFGNSSLQIEESIREIIEQTEILEGLVVELCGRWIWFGGDTYKWKGTLKSIGCFWASKKKAWYWRPADEAISGKHKTLSIEEIRERHGSKVFQKVRPLLS